MKEEYLDDIRGCIEETLGNVLDQFLSTHEFKLSDGTIIQGRPMTKVMNPDKTKLLVCYGGVRVDGCTLIVQTGVSCWERHLILWIDGVISQKYLLI